MAIATSYASIYRNCSEKTEKRNIGIPSYSWFLFQFWPILTILTLHQLWCTKQEGLKLQEWSNTRLFRKHNPDSHYCNAINSFMKERAIAHKDIFLHFLVLMRNIKLQLGNLVFLSQLLQGVGKWSLVIINLLKMGITISAKSPLFQALFLYKTFRQKRRAISWWCTKFIVFCSHTLLI